MPNVTFSIPTPIIVELNAIAVEAGFPNAKVMTIAYLKATIRASRGNKALIGLRERAEAQANADTEAIA